MTDTRTGSIAESVTDSVTGTGTRTGSIAGSSMTGIGVRTGSIAGSSITGSMTGSLSKGQKRIKIVHWSDFACPFCYIGDKRLESVLDELNIKDRVDIEMKAFELDKDASKKPKMKIDEFFAKKNGLTLEGAQDRVVRISALGRDEGIDMNFEKCQFTNTFDCHRLTKYIAKHGKDVQKFITLVYDAYFTKNLVISDRELLIKLAEEVGVTKKEATKLLKSKEFTDEVRRDELIASKRNYKSVPQYVINDEYTISGCESKAGIKAVLEKVLAAEEKVRTKGLACYPDGCY